ncbi:MAG: DNA-binding protein WhiA [Clostridia bacterium]|nr:DNA-binding protein WhiA [Clostridia bacterium]
MSFSGDVKREISKVNYDNRCCKVAELSALLLTCGRIVLKGRMRFEVLVVTMENNVAYKIIELVKALYGIRADICVSRNRRLNKNSKYSLTFYDSAAVTKMLEETTILSYDDEGFCNISHKDWQRLFVCEDCCNAFLRGVFAGAGSVNNPVKYNHMEFVIYDSDFATAFCEYLNSRDIRCKMLERDKGFYMVYLKEAECIVDVLRAIGAATALFSYENIRIKKNIKNKVTRIVNCEMANQNKSIEAGLAQKRYIEYIVEKKGWGYLPKTLKSVAECRMEAPDVSLTELGQMLSPPLGKSGVNHRMNKIKEMAEELMLQYGDEADAVISEE